MKLVASREVDAAVIASNVLRIKLRAYPELCEQLQILESWGPFPIQPVGLRCRSSSDAKEPSTRGITYDRSGPTGLPTLAEFGL